MQMSSIKVYLKPHGQNHREKLELCLEGEFLKENMIYVILL